MEVCSICGEDINNKFKFKINNCNHEFHYECLMKTYQYQHRLSCPYCREKGDLLPIVNSVKPIKGVHYNNIKELYDENGFEKNINTRCDYIYKRGNNKGGCCNKKCMIGYNQCKLHLSKN